MFSIQASPLPDNALLAAYSRDGAYTGCYAVDVPGTISQEQYIAAFYTSAVSNPARLTLRLAVLKPPQALGKKAESSAKTAWAR